MIDFELQVQQDVYEYQGEYQELITCAPQFYRLLTNILDDPDLPGRLRPLILVALAYFLTPVDIISEDLIGPRGYLDDIFLTAFIADYVQKELGSDAILVRSWEGQGSISEIIQKIFHQEKELIGDKRELILWYIGFEFLATALKHE